MESGVSRIAGLIVARRRTGARAARILPSPDEPDVVRFEDNNGIVVEVKAAK